MSGSALGFLAVVVLAGSGFLWVRALQRVRLPENRGGFVAAWLCAAALAIGALVQGAGWIGGTAAVLALVGATFGLLTFAISAQKLGGDAITVGATLPDFSALDEDGQRFQATSLAGRPALIKFFRGHW